MAKCALDFSLNVGYILKETERTYVFLQIRNSDFQNKKVILKNQVFREELE